MFSGNPCLYEDVLTPGSNKKCARLPGAISRSSSLKPLAVRAIFESVLAILVLSLSIWILARMFAALIAVERPQGLAKKGMALRCRYIAYGSVQTTMPVAL